MFADRPWERAHSDDVTVDLDDLGDGAYVAFADDEPGAFSHELRVGRFVEVRPGQADSSSLLRSTTRSSSGRSDVGVAMAELIRSWGFARTLCSQVSRTVSTVC